MDLWTSLGPLRTTLLIYISQRLVYRNNDQSRDLWVYGLGLILFPWLLSAWITSVYSGTVMKLQFTMLSDVSTEEFSDQCCVEGMVGKLGHYPLSVVIELPCRHLGLGTKYLMLLKVGAN